MREGQPMQNWAYSAQGQNNPYWLMNQNSSVAKEDRFFGNVTGTLDIYDGLSFQARLGMDFSKYESESKRYATTWLPASMEDIRSLLVEFLKDNRPLHRLHAYL